jgi:CobQ-like glutamine amidotransferase family enzyme
VQRDELTVVLVYPEALGTYGDRGNALALRHRATARGLPCRVVEIFLGEAIPCTGDVYLLGGGEDAAQTLAAEWLSERPELCTVLTERPTLAVCAGLQVLGLWMQDARGRRTTGVGILDLTTEAGPQRAVGEVLTRCEIPGVGTLTGFENHRGITTLGPGLRPLGRVARGVGNGTGGDDEGVLAGTLVGTYMHGPVLARNPALADHLLEAATGDELAPLELPDQEAVRRLRLDPSEDRPPSSAPDEPRSRRLFRTA